MVGERWRAISDYIDGDVSRHARLTGVRCIDLHESTEWSKVVVSVNSLWLLGMRSRPYTRSVFQTNMGRPVRAAGIAQLRSNVP
jgi:hypothetical protein